MTTFESVWRKLNQGKKYREQFALAFLKRSVPFQIKTLRKKHCGSQAVLAERSGVTQGVVSRAEDQDYGNLTLNTIGRIAGGLDMAFIGRFVPFSDLAKFSLEMSEKEVKSIPTFEEENAALSSAGQGASVVHGQNEFRLSQRIGPQRVEGNNFGAKNYATAAANMPNPSGLRVVNRQTENVVTISGYLKAMEGGKTDETIGNSLV